MTIDDVVRFINTHEDPVLTPEMDALHGGRRGAREGDPPPGAARASAGLSRDCAVSPPALDTVFGGLYNLHRKKSLEEELCSTSLCSAPIRSL